MYSNSEVNYKDIIFDFKRREVVKSNEEKGVTKEQSLVNAFYEKTGKKERQNDQYL